MKKLGILLLGLFFVTVAYAQDVPEKSTTIVITGSDSATVAAKLGDALKKKGYTMNKTKSTDTYNATPVQLKNNNRFTLTVQYKGKEIYLTGVVGFIGQPNQKVIYNPKKDTPFFIAWEEMTKLAKATGAAISYK